MAEAIQVDTNNNADGGLTSSLGSSRSKSAKDPELPDAKIGFLGAGKMTECIVTGLINFANVRAGNIHVAASWREPRKKLDKFKEMGCHVTKSKVDIFGKCACDIVFITCPAQRGTRPQPITVNIIPKTRKPLHILSLVNGWDIKPIKNELLKLENQKKVEMHRIAANCSVAYGVGLWAVDCDPESPQLSPLVRTMLSALGDLEKVDEAHMNAVNETIHAGTAFVYSIAKVLEDRVCELGLERPLALKTATKVMESTVSSVLKSGKNLAQLRDDAFPMLAKDKAKKLKRIKF